MIYKCHKCEDGVRVSDENGWPIREGCYHCGATGQLSFEQVVADALDSVLQTIAASIVDVRRKGVDASAAANGDCEGWAFHAAENMMNEHDYTEACVITEEDRLRLLFKDLGPSQKEGFARAFLGNNFPQPEPTDTEIDQQYQRIAEGKGEVRPIESSSDDIPF
jgi:hypothetical protein